MVTNAFLAQRVSSINSLSALCEKTDADITEIAYAVGSDSRIGRRYLEAGVGFGGSCFRKDILNLVYIARSYGLNEVADYWEMVVKLNDFQRQRFVQRIINEMFNTLVGKKIALFGFSFKANTGDTRDSPALYVARQLLAEKAQLAITDPQALDNARNDLAEYAEQVLFTPDPYAAAADAHAIVLVTGWPSFQQLDYQKIFRGMKKPAFLFDGRNIFDHPQLFAIGFNVYPLGKPALTHFA